MEDRKLALNAVGRGTCKKLRMPVAGDRMHHKNRRLALNLDQHHDSRGHRYRRRRVHHNTQRTMIGIRIDRVDVRNLRHRQQRQQNQTHNGRHPQSTRLRTAFPAENGLKSCQHTDPLL